MKTRIPRGDTNWNNSQVLPAGRLVFDRETQALRVHNGESLGGLALSGQRAFYGPGPQTLAAGNSEAGFYGEVLSSELISGSDLAALVGIAYGRSQHTDSGWLKFSSGGKILYVAKQPIRYALSWSQLNAIGAIKGELTVAIGSLNYRVRVLTGAEADPSEIATTASPTSTESSEWETLIYPVHADDPLSRHWADYTDADLIVGTANGPGSLSWCQETSADNSTNSLGRGSASLTRFYWASKSYTDNVTGWRPALELIQ